MSRNVSFADDDRSAWQDHESKREGAPMTDKQSNEGALSGARLPAADWAPPAALR
jgi:hypothetical protein